MNYQRQRQRGFGAGGERNVSQESTKTSKIASETIAWTPGRLEEAHGMTIPNETMESAIWGENRITPQELDAARQTVRRFPELSRSELARTICEHWGWEKEAVRCVSGGTGKIRPMKRVRIKLVAQGMEPLLQP